MNAITADRLSRSFGQRKALTDVSFAVEAGSVFGLLGMNGAGKTTCIRLLLGLMQPDNGTIDVLGNDPATNGNAVRSVCGTLLEEAGLYQRLSAWDNLEFYARLNKVPKNVRGTRIENLLSSIGLWERRAEKVTHFSKGMKQQLAVARALVHAPAIVFLDEPTANLDPKASADLRRTITSLAATGDTTVFLTTHNLTEAEQLCDHVAILKAGRIALSGTPASLRAKHSKPQLHIRTGNMSDDLIRRLSSVESIQVLDATQSSLVLALPQDGDAAPVVQALVSIGVRVTGVDIRLASLEDVFLSATSEAP